MRAQGVSLRTFTDGVYQRIEARLRERCRDATQAALISDLVVRFRAAGHQSLSGDVLGIYYRTWRGAGGVGLEDALEGAVICAFHIMGLALLDDVQDDELSAAVHQSIGPEMAVNTGLACLALAHDGLRRLAEGDRARAARCWSAYSNAHWAAVEGQHRDLYASCDPTAVDTPEEALAVALGKSSAVPLLMEFAAIFAGASPALLPLYRRAGTEAGALVQLVDDCRNLFGKRAASDARAGRITYPYACYLSLTGQPGTARLQALREGLPDSLPELQQLLYESGALRLVAAQVEWHRRALHTAVASLHAAGQITGRSPDSEAQFRALLQIFDGVASCLYRIEELDETRALMRPGSAWHERLQAMTAAFCERLAPHGPPAPPPLAPQVAPGFRYHNVRNCILYPDVEGLPEDTLSSGMAAFGREEASMPAAVERLERLAPAMLAHELFHHWRDATGNTTQDAWYEELVAGTLTAAYVREHAPELLAELRTFLVSQAVSPEHGWQPRAARVLGQRLESARPSPVPRGYGMSPAQATRVQASLFLRLIDEGAPHTLDALIRRYLASPPPGGQPTSIWQA